MAELNNEPQNKEQEVDIQVEIEKARKQERDKLHADIERLKTEIAEKAKVNNENYVTIADLRKEVDKKAKEIADFEKKLAQAKEDGKVEANKELESVKKELEDTKKELEKAQKEFADYKEAEEIKAYKLSKLTDIDEDFKNLVKGKTKEEIDASYTEVKALQDKVKDKYSKKEKEQLPNPKSDKRRPAKPSELLERLKGMSIDEYKEARKKNFK